MRLTIINKTGRPDADVHPYVELAASLSSAKGKVTLQVYNTRQGRAWGGYCAWSRRVPHINIGVPKDKASVAVREVTTLGYFRQHSIPLRRPYTINNWEELLTGIAAHEFGHLMKRGHQGRKSVFELFCEEQKAIALEHLRTPEGRDFIKNCRETIIAIEKCEGIRERAKKAEKRNPDAKREKLLAAQKRWTTKAFDQIAIIPKITNTIELRAIENMRAPLQSHAGAMNE